MANSPASPASAGATGASSPLACRVHGPSAAASSGRACTSTERCPPSSGPPTVTWTWTAPSAGSISGACRVSSSTRPQPAWSPARIASSTNAVPGSSTVPPTA